MKETWERKMRENSKPCARAEDLVAYLYKEATQAEARDFEKHKQHCASCRTEVSAFSDVREAIGEWRQQSLGTLSSPAFESNDVTAFAAPRETIRPRRSALAALREFFALSPVWMRAATAAVALVFCALVVIAIAHFREQSKVVVAGNPDTMKITPQGNKREVVIKESSSKESTVNQNTEATPPQRGQMAKNNQQQSPKQTKRGGIGSQQFAKLRRNQFLPRDNDRPSAELVENDYLPFTAPRNEEKLPSLADLADEPE